VAQSDFKNWMNAAREQIEREAQRDKDTPRALVELQRLYRSFDDAERTAADEVAIAWALSDDLDKRFDGLAMINMHEIRSAVPALRELARRLPGEQGPQSPYDLAKVQRILAKLTECPSE